MSPVEMACATCHAPLNVLDSAPGDPPAYIHPLSFDTDGHPAVPVPAHTLDTIARRCDFCGDHYPVWTLHTKQAISVLAYNNHGGLAQNYGDTWAACAPCEQLAADQNTHELAARAAATMGDRDEQTLRHITQLHATFLHQASMVRSLVTTTAWPPASLGPRDLPKVRDRLARMLAGPDQLPTPYTDQVRQRLADGLLLARLYWIDPEFTTLAGHAASHLPDTILEPDQLPAQRGVLVWAQPVTSRHLAAASWTIEQDQCQVVCYRHIGTGLPGPALQRIREQIGWLVPTGLINLPLGQPLPGDGPAAPVLATWLLITQKAAETVPAHLDRATRRAYTRQARAAPEVRIVRIRARPRHHTGRTGGSSGRGRGPLRQREWVGGHWKHQAYGPKRGQRHLIYIHPYLRGPDGTQIRAATTVRVLGTTRNPPDPTAKEEE